MTQIDQSEMEAIAQRKKAENLAQLVVDKEKDRQRELASNTMGKIVFDIIEFEDFHGDAVIVWVYAEKATRDLRVGQEVIAMILWPSPMCHPKFKEDDNGFCRKLGVRFEQAKFASGALVDERGQNLLETIQSGGYPY